ncbi:hypothetical protein K4K49_001383 [Colletotrichum sp. SAR 10_70]|nr:hypothetical protein K4K50_000874 [Colletotrichum sp. SAR 10_71]KAI8177518.1 hypothetical protein KHU50_003591 [Colletotrichum sp. SAR 10_65]KAI8180490.1 hypothetical protein K4K49_001383 [Colletotrichum sp. SAR 10_70]KAI8229337.1 hypothetical protein K4K54_001584 [Colletotrichum sp. SAR 10_86]
MHDSRFAPEQSKPPQGVALKALFITTLVALLIVILLMYFIDHLSRRHFWVRRRLERFCDSQCEHWRDKLPLGRSDAFSFLFHDLLTMSTESKKRLLDILRAAELEQEGFHGGMFPDEWLEFLPWRTVQALHPAVSMSSSDLPANNSGDQGPEVIYGSKAWFQTPHDGRILPKIVHHPDTVTTTGVLRNSRRLKNDDACLDNILTALMEPLIRDMRASHRVTPTEDLTFSWEFMFAIRWAWTDNPYLVDFQTRHEVPIWGVPMPKRLLAAGTDTGAGPRRRVFKPHFGFVGFWAGAFQIAVDSAARAARVELDEDLDLPAPKDLEKVINGFRMLHTALLSNFADAFDGNRDATVSLEEVVQQAFHDAVTSEYTHEMDREVEEHWRAIAKWRPSGFGSSSLRVRYLTDRDDL